MVDCIRKPKLFLCESAYTAAVGMFYGNLSVYQIPKVLRDGSLETKWWLSKRLDHQTGVFERKYDLDVKVNKTGFFHLISLKYCRNNSVEKKLPDLFIWVCVIPVVANIIESYNHRI